MPFWRPRGCVLWLDFLEPSGSVAYDKSGYGNHGTIYGAQRVRALGRYGLSFDGVDDYVEVPPSPSLDITDEVTVEALICPLSLPAGEHIIAGKLPQPERSWELDQAGTRLEWWVYDGATWHYARKSNYLSVGEWFHAVGVYKSSTGELFLYGNGELLATGSSPAMASAPDTPVTIASTNTPDRWFNGIIAFVRIYNRALTPHEIKANYAYFFSHLKGEV